MMPLCGVRAHAITLGPARHCQQGGLSTSQRGPRTLGSSSLAGTRLSCSMNVQLLSNESSPFYFLDSHFCPCEETQNTERDASEHISRIL